MVELRHVANKVIHGLEVRTDNAAEMSPDKGKIPALWQAFDEAVPVDYKNGERVYGVYSDYESDHTGEFTVLAGFDGQSLPPDVNLKQRVIPAAKYLVFSHKGNMPQIAIDAWTEIWEYFSNPDSEYKRVYSTDFEYYPSADAIEVHIAVL
ncbi:effector binding domain-containing protein [Oceanobacter sp. 5_MG-2023]|uniref:GyrI-like domain-containing protein n=1 Tax=Oceanobacter sp. 5_MG-2023 TaxID=3062645 RepID=UPI0026E1EF03|nr:effector binding domain-containing protein [Oceanobacter sp. 5_MG-2023]MDO6682507.1 effector binding domain-containing protein [Oceanobacter sp. 5_MG-2023]